MRLLSDPEVTTIIVEHRDRLARFGFEYIEAALIAQGRKIIVIEPGEIKDDLVQDIEVLTSFCARHKTQLILLKKHAGCARFAWNWGLSERKRLWEEERKTTNAIELVN